MDGCVHVDGYVHTHPLRGVGIEQVENPSLDLCLLDRGRAMDFPLTGPPAPC